MATTRCVIVEQTESGPLVVSPTGGAIIYDDVETANQHASRMAAEKGGNFYVQKLTTVSVHHRYLNAN